MASKTLTMTVYSNKGLVGTEMTFPLKRVVCPRCNGEGVHDRPGFEGGLTCEDMEDPDFKLSYLTGVYEIRCTECKGKNVVDEIDEDACTPEQIAALREHYEIEHAAEMEAYYERRWGC